MLPLASFTPVSSIVATLEKSENGKSNQQENMSSLGFFPLFSARPRLARSHRRSLLHFRWQLTVHHRLRMK